VKILFDHPNPFILAHGGFQIQIEQTYKALREIGVSVEYLRWWDDSQKADIIHYFGRPALSYLGAAQQKGMKVVLGELLTGLGSRSPRALWVQRTMTALARKTLPWTISSRFGWDAFVRADACVALTAWEAHLMEYILGAPRERVHIVPNGVEEVFLNSPSVNRERWLICTATITERKRVVELAEAAVQAQTPLWVIGKPYSEQERYYQRFLTVAKASPNTIRYDGEIADRGKLARVYREARGFVLLSDKESLSLSALEAAACQCPLLLSDLPWARTVFADQAFYCSIKGSARETADLLKHFYDKAPTLRTPAKPLTWIEVAEQLKTVYQTLLRTSR
jgi:glycosyltransferase involved in cell wall biosynthesis